MGIREGNNRGEGTMEVGSGGEDMDRVGIEGGGVELGMGTTIEGDTILNLKLSRGISTFRIYRLDRKGRHLKVKDSSSRTEDATMDEGVMEMEVDETILVTAPLRRRQLKRLAPPHPPRLSRPTIRQWLPLHRLPRCLPLLRPLQLRRHRHQHQPNGSPSPKWRKNKQRRCKSAPSPLRSTLPSTHRDISAPKRPTNEKSVNSSSLLSEGELMRINDRCEKFPTRNSSSIGIERTTLVPTKSTLSMRLIFRRLRRRRIRMDAMAIEEDVLSRVDRRMGSSRGVRVR